MGRQLVGLAHGESGLKIGLDHIFRRRQDVGDEIVAQLDVGIERTADLELFQGVEAGGDHGGETECQNDAESNDCGRKRKANFHGTIQ
ncbi:hypothetical protein ACVWZW_008686 [Bradyrhizobium sp. F1.13.4]